MRVLLLDDNPDDRLAAGRVLLQEFPSAELVEPVDLASFERLLDGAAFDAVVSDYQVRWSDGITLLQRLKRAFPYTPFILLTSSGSELVAVAAMKAGADDYLIKSPRHMDQLPAAVRNAIAHAKTRRRLAEVETDLISLMDGLEVGVFQTTPDGQLIDCNRAFLRLIGRKTLEEAKAVDLDGLLHRPEGEGNLNATYRGERLKRREQRVRRPDGSMLWVTVSERIIERADGPVIQGMVENVTERRHAEDQLRIADRRKDEFLATLAHELRNPLAPIRQAVHIAKSPAASAEQLTWSHDVIERQVRHMARLLDDLLDVSRITRGRVELRREWVALSEALDTAIETARPVLGARRNRLTVKALPNIHLHADSLRLAQIVSNLLTNAAKYSEPDSEIVLEAREQGQWVIVEVVDRGIGIEPAMIEQVFEMFAQAKASLDRSDGGLGVGLALVKGLVDLHGGDVRAASEGLGAGARFTVRLPRGRPPGGPHAVRGPIGDDAAGQRAAPLS